MGKPGTGTGKYPKRGFASMDPEVRREIASMGGVAAHRHGAHEWTRETAVTAGRKGGLASAAVRRRKRAES